MRVDFSEADEMQHLKSPDALVEETPTTVAQYKNAKTPVHLECSHTEDGPSDHPATTTTTAPNQPHPYTLYPHRYLGLLHLMLLNIVVSWSWLTFAPVSSTSATYFSLPQTSINWLSTAFLFAFLPPTPLVILALNKGGPKTSILISSVLVLVGNWIRYAGTAAGAHGKFGVVVFGQVVIGFAQPFVLAAPSRYANLWFSDSGRVSAIAVMTLANPLGAALGQLIGPLWAPGTDSGDTSGIPKLVLYTAILSTVSTIPAPFLPRAPPTPPSAIAAEEPLDLRPAFKILPKNPSFWLLFIPFSLYVALFNATSSLLNQILEPYAFTETQAGIAGGLLILVGLVASALVSPLVDRTKAYLWTIKLLVPLIAASYVILIFVPSTRSIAGVYTICAALGATSFALLPCALEYLVVVTHPVSPEITSTICWSGGQLLGAVFILVMGALEGEVGQPAGSLRRALIFQAVIACVAVVPALMLGLRGKSGRGVAAVS
ncbi:MFS general substrate transporter [Teratosphaeria destructans]|uniref:MFS general substrate transporter n=1 Tax=Teratosphaeria destructans TaxID=418781 RepID=A0A9W7SJP5_9PEZI|nr:MFS general substrate transporter [Teratosphaeria destructans]